MGLVTQQDPIGIAGGLNLYGYANGDPINFSDPFGLYPCPPICSENELAWMAVGSSIGFWFGGGVGGAAGSLGGPVAVGTSMGGAALGTAAGAGIGVAVGGLIDAGIHFLSDRTDKFGRKNPLDQLDEIEAEQAGQRAGGRPNMIESIEKSTQRVKNWLRDLRNRDVDELLDDLDDLDDF